MICLLCDQEHGDYTLQCGHTIKAPCNDSRAESKLLWCPICATGVKVFAYLSPIRNYGAKEVNELLYGFEEHINDGPSLTNMIVAESINVPASQVHLLVKRRPNETLSQWADRCGVIRNLKV